MNKVETKKLTDMIKGYYNSTFFIDEFVINAWYETMKPYELDDAIEHIKEWITSYPDTIPKPQTFIKGLLTTEQKIARRNANFTVECNLCHKFMTLEEYEEHYSNCLDIQYLSSVAKKKKEDYSRDKLESCTKEVINKLMAKYPPEAVWND